VAIVDEGSLGSANEKTSDNAIAMTTTQDANVGDAIIVVTAWDNNNGTTIAGPANSAWTISDDGGNSYSILFGGEDASSNGRSALGVYIAIVAGSTLSSGATITATYNSSRTAKSITAHRFSMDGTGLRIAFRDLWFRRAADPTAFWVQYEDLSAEMGTSEILAIYAMSAEGPNTDAYTFTDTENGDTWTTLGADDGTTGSTDDTNMHHRARFIIRSGGDAVAEEFQCDSDTADRDYTQGGVLLTEIASSPPTIPPVPDIYDGTVAQHDRRIGANSIGKGVQPTSVSITAGRTFYLPLAGAPVGAFLIVTAASDNNATVTETGPTDTATEITDSAGNTWTELSGAQHAQASESGSAVWQYVCIVQNEIPRGGYITLRLPNATGLYAWAAEAHLWSLEGGTYTVEQRAMAKGTNADPTDAALSAMTSRKYLIIGTVAAEWGTNQTYTLDGDYTTFTPVGFDGGNESSMTEIMVYRIATLTADTFSFSMANATDSTVMLTAVYNDVVATPFTQQTRRWAA
jgi:hypothetical protein